MRRAVEVKESPGMKLKNAIAKEVPADGIDILEELKRMDSIQKVLGFRLKGPQVIKRWPDMIDGQIVERTSLIIQCEGIVPQGLPQDIGYCEEIRSGRSVFVDFTGREEALSIVSSKISVYAYENGLELTGEAYTVFLDREGPIVTVNVHCPIAAKE